MYYNLKVYCYNEKGWSNVLKQQLHECIKCSVHIAHKQLSELTTAPISSFSDYNRNFDTKDLNQ